MGLFSWLHELSIQKRFDQFAEEQEKLHGEERRKQAQEEREKWLRNGPCARCGGTESIISKDLGGGDGLQPLCWRCDPYRGILDPRAWASWESYPYKSQFCRTREEFNAVHQLSKNKGRLNMGISLTLDDGRSWDDLTEEEYDELSARLDAETSEKENKIRTELEQVTNIKTEVQKLCDLRQQQKETEERIRGLGYKISKNSPEEMFYSLRSRVFKKLGYELVAETSSPLYGSSCIEEWLIPLEDDEKVEKALEDEYDRERLEDNEEN